MTLEEAIKKNPYDPAKGNEAAYVRYLRYNVDGFYDLDSKTVRRMWEESRGKKDGRIHQTCGHHEISDQEKSL